MGGPTAVPGRSRFSRRRMQRSPGNAALAPRAHVPRGTSSSSCGCQRANVRPSPAQLLRPDTSPAERHPRHRSQAEQGWDALHTARAAPRAPSREAVERTPCQPADVVSARNPDVTPSASTAILGSPVHDLTPHGSCPSQRRRGDHLAMQTTRGQMRSHSRSRRARPGATMRPPPSAPAAGRRVASGALVAVGSAYRVGRESPAGERGKVVAGTRRKGTHDESP